jgi:streptogrisin D
MTTPKQKINLARPSRRRNFRPPALTAFAVASLLVGALLTPSSAEAVAIDPTPTAGTEDTSTVPVPEAAPTDVPVTSGITGAKAEALASTLGTDRTGGVYLNGDGRMVVTVTDEADAQAVRDSGGIAQVVKYSAAKLDGIHTDLDRLATSVPGSSWGVDPATNQVSVELDSTVSAADAAKLEAVTDKYGDAVKVDRIPGTIELDTATSGGDMIDNVFENGGCSLGFNVAANANGTKYFLTAGHCITSNHYWYRKSGMTYLGYNTAHSFPSNDFGIVRYDNSSIAAYGTVHNDTQQITSSRYPVDGESVSRAGGVSNDLVGQVLLVNTTVNYKQGSVYNVIKTSNCSNFGDSGGPLYHGTVALGLLSGGSGSHAACNTNVSKYRTYYMPVQKVLSLYGLHVY